MPLVPSDSFAAGYLLDPKFNIGFTLDPYWLIRKVIPLILPSKRTRAAKANPEPGEFAFVFCV
jgi:hypothetical protein